MLPWHFSNTCLALFNYKNLRSVLQIGLDNIFHFHHFALHLKGLQTFPQVWNIKDSQLLRSTTVWSFKLTLEVLAISVSLEVKHIPVLPDFRHVE